MVRSVLCAIFMPIKKCSIVHRIGYLTTSIKPIAEAVKLNKKLYPVIELMMKPITDAHIKIVIVFVTLVLSLYAG